MIRICSAPLIQVLCFQNANALWEKLPTVTVSSLYLDVTNRASDMKAGKKQQTKVEATITQ